jgi:hypothetical protein
MYPIRLILLRDPFLSYLKLPLTELFRIYDGEMRSKKEMSEPEVLGGVVG